eukprot:TRINITY_DN78835_c0_g1_i1.p1 TRINITY_DN78835_c0_g1~~TRINITY_DN78835_c0_g1_i1.p1  ORF type:complete len:480 (-),score=72.28 TRINITY_DN78835_c0_g1_i1:127-1566(-)
MMSRKQCLPMKRTRSSRLLLTSCACMVLAATMWKRSGAASAPAVAFQDSMILGGAVFSMLCVLALGKVGSKLVLPLGLPSLFGMLLSGYMLRNYAPWCLAGLPAELNSGLRKVALGIIMIRGGMSLNLDALRAQFASMVLLSWVPCLTEAATIACLCHFLFPIMDMKWSFMLGFVIADVSPAVTTPILLDLMSKGYGAVKGIPSVLLAAGNINSVFAIVLYSMIWELAWSADLQPSALLEIVVMKFFVQLFGVGVLAGIGFGHVTAQLWPFAGDTPRRFALVVAVAMASIFGFAQVGMGGGGTLAVLTFGASLQYYVEKQGLPATDEVASWIGIFWTEFGQICLFTLLGASVDQSKLDSSMLGWAALLVFLGLAGRTIAACVSMIPNHSWNWKEKVYVMVSWCPKATVQAALATRALDYVTDCVANGDPAFQDADYIETVTEQSNIILTTAVLSIIMTAPLFAILMSVLGPRLLTVEKP